MLRGGRRYIIAAVGLLAAAIAFLWVASNYYYQFQEATEDRYAAESYQPARDARLPPPRPNQQPQPRAYQPNCQQPQTHEDADLCAQWGSVKAVNETNRLTRLALNLAALGFLFAVFGSFVGLIGTVLIWLAWRETRAANRIARRDFGRARVEARKAAKIAEKQLADADRPHLIVSSVEIEDLEALPLEDKIAIKYMFSNHGPSPAWMIAHGVWFFFALPDEVPETFNVEQCTTTYWPIPPGQGWGVSEFDRERGSEVSPDVRKAILGGSLKMLAYGIVSCIDANGREHSNTFVYEYSTKRKMLIPMQHPFWKYT